MSIELIDELRSTFEYHEDGYLIRKKNGKPCGMHANHNKGYARVNVGGRKLYAHRIIFAIMTGKMPEGEVDHLNGDRADNRIENLREVSSSENSHNYKMPRTNSSGFTGVHYHAPLRKWCARIMVNKRRISLGYFEDFEEAVQARKMAKIRYHPSSPEAVKFASE